MKFSTPVSSTPALCAAPVAFAVIPPVAVAGEYSHEPVTLPAEPGAWPVRVCHIKQNGEFLFEIPHCRSVRHEEEPSGHLLFIAKFPHYEANDTTGVYAFDKSSGTVTDSIFAVSYDGIVQDGDKTMVMVSYYKHGHDDDFMGSVNMPRTYELWNGKFTEIDPGPYADWTKLAVETAWLIGLDLTVSYAPSTLPPVAAINSVYHASSRQLREIFTYLDRYGLEESSDEGAAICTHSLAMTEAEVYLDALNRHGTAFYDGTLGRFAETDKFAHALRKHTDALYADTGLSWLYKQGRYHVMDGTDLLWSSPVQALAGPLGIVEAPAEQLLFLLGRPAPGAAARRCHSMDLRQKKAHRHGYPLAGRRSAHILRRQNPGSHRRLEWGRLRSPVRTAAFPSAHPQQRAVDRGQQRIHGSTEPLSGKLNLWPSIHLSFTSGMQGDIYGCRHYEDVIRALKEIKASRNLPGDNEDRITILDSE